MEILLFFLITQSYVLKSSVISSGGSNAGSLNYALKGGTLSQLTASSAWLTSNNYRAIIGFWNPSYKVKIEEKNTTPPEKNLVNMLYPACVTPHKIIFLFSIASKSYVKLDIFNVTGRKIKTLVSRKLEPGLYRTEWNKKVPQGVYFYRLKTEKFQKTRKLVILKK